MATLQQNRLQEKEGQWSSVFPAEQVTEQQSTLFMKKLLAIAISSISYLRALFPEKAFGDRCLEDISVKILRDDSECPEACQVIQWIRGCFDALEKKYLQAVLVGIFVDPDDPDTVIEQYTFKISYGAGIGIDIYRNGDKVASSVPEQETKKQTIRLLRTIILLSQTFSPLPDDVMMTMKLLYYDDVTPEDYNPPGFKDCPVHGFNFKDDPTNIRVGDVATPFHTFRLRIKSAHHDLQALGEGEDKENAPATGLSRCLSQMKVADAKPEVCKSLAKGGIHDEKRAKIPVESTEESIQMDSSQLGNKTMQVTKRSFQLSGESSQQDVVNCPCGDSEDDGLMILCASCNTWQHGFCFAILRAEEAPEAHYCVQCSKGNGKHQCTDKTLTKLQTVASVKELCLWRRALCAVLEESRVLAPNLAKRLSVSIVAASDILKRLEEEGFVVSGGKAKRFGKIVQKDEIRNRGFKKYFLGVQDEPMTVAKQDVNMMIDEASALQISNNIIPSEEKPANTSGSKRKSTEVVSRSDQSLRFETVSDSQDTPPEQTSFKRRKTSVTTKSMLL